MREMIFLGAGASVEAGVPDTFGMTKSILQRFRENPLLRQHSRVLAFVAGGLLFQTGIRGEDPLDGGINVEELFNAVQLLAERQSLEAAPFVGSWHSMVDEFDKDQPPRAQARDLHRAIYESVTKQIVDALPHSAPSFGGKDIDEKIHKAIQKTVEGIARGRSTLSISSIDSVGRAVGDYVVKFTNDWIGKLKHYPNPSHDFERQIEKLSNQQPRPGGVSSRDREAGAYLRKSRS